MPPPPTYSPRELAPVDVSAVPFASFDVSPSLLQGMKDMGYLETRPVQSDAGHEVLAQLSGRMRRFRIKVVPGDRVTVGVSPYDPVRGIITFRAR